MVTISCIKRKYPEMFDDLPKEIKQHPQAFDIDCACIGRRLSGIAISSIYREIIKLKELKANAERNWLVEFHGLKIVSPREKPKLIEDIDEMILTYEHAIKVFQSMPGCEEEGFVMFKGVR